MTTWLSYAHHLSLHGPLVFSVFLAVLGVWMQRTDTPELRLIMRWGGWATFIATTLAVVSGLIMAWGAEDITGRLDHHRWLGITAWCTMLTAALAFELGLHRDDRDLRRFGAITWIAVALAVIGTGHWGGSMLHPEAVPWLSS